MVQRYKQITWTGDNPAERRYVLWFCSLLAFLRGSKWSKKEIFQKNKKMVLEIFEHFKGFGVWIELCELEIMRLQDGAFWCFRVLGHL